MIEAGYFSRGVRTNRARGRCGVGFACVCGLLDNAAMFEPAERQRPGPGRPSPVRGLPDAAGEDDALVLLFEDTPSGRHDPRSRLGA